MRIAGWEEALIAAIEHHAALPFAWGVSDCFLLASDNIAAVAGASPLAKFCGYKTEAGAAKKLMRTGHADLGELFASILPEIPPSLAQRGDVGVVLRNGRFSAGVFTSSGFASKAETGVIDEPITAVARAFKVD